MASVEIQKLVKYYGDSQVLHGIDISISDGEFVVLVGPSGCGKSTLLRMVAGLEEISDGHVAIDGQIINDLPPKQRDLAMVFQSYALYPHMTVGENMGFSLRLAKRPKDEISREVARVAEILGLTEYINRYPRHLSGGQRQRVAMGRAIVRDPKVFLFDEPLSNLDAKLRGQMRAEIKNMHRRLATTTIYVTHDQTEAMTMADKIVVLRDGRVEQIGSPMELFKNPRNQFVAGFIGSPSMNFLSGTVNERKIEFPDGTFLPCASEIPLSSGAPVTVGIRPRHFECVDANAAHNFIVDDVEPTGDEMEVRGRMHGETVTAVLETFETNIGQSLKLNSQPSRRFIFDGDTGKRIF